MARKRGGLAGLYDRNKGIIKKVAPAALSFIPGAGIPLAIAAGAALGADREGYGYFEAPNVGGALRGGLEGYGIGKGTQSLAGGVKGLLTGSKAAAPLPGSGAATAPKFQPTFQGIGAPLDGSGFGSMTDLPAMAPKVGITPGMGVTSAPPPISGAGLRAANAPNMLAQNAPNLFSKARNFVSQNKDLIELGGKGIQSVLPNPASEAAMMNAETERMRFEEDRRQAKLEEERRRLIAELLMPYFQQQFPNLGR